MAQRRRDWREHQGDLDAGRLIFIDETWAKTNMTRLRGRAPVGQRLIDKTPHGHWKTTTPIAALDASGIRCSTVVDGAVDADTFESFVQQVLAPTLRPGDIVVLDNLSSHKRPRTCELIRSCGADLWFLPPYSPDLNPIENVFVKIKQRLRSLACRTRETLWSAMQGVLDELTPGDAVTAFANAATRYGRGEDALGVVHRRPWDKVRIPTASWSLRCRHGCTVLRFLVSTKA